MEILIAVIIFAVGFGIGFLVHRPVGDLRVDRSDPLDPPYLFLDLDSDVYSIMRKKNIMLRVKMEDYIIRLNDNPYYGANSNNLKGESKHGRDKNFVR